MADRPLLQQNAAACMPETTPTIGRSPLARLRVGFLALLDAAPLLAAHELGLFEAEGFAATLHRQLGWASIRDKILYGALDVAHAPAGFLYAINSGATPNVGRCVSAFVLSAQGNAITISRRLYDRGIHHAADLPAEVRARRPEILTLGIVSQHSSHAHLLRGWLQHGGIDYRKDVRIVVLPPQQMVASLAAGHIDGFCAGEPWNTLAVSEGHGWIAAESGALTPMHPEKILLVHEDFARNRPDAHLRLVRTLREACTWCADPSHRSALAKLLLRWAFVDVPEKVLLRSLSGPLAPIFDGPELHAPTEDKARWILGEMRQHDLLPASADDADLLASFRADLYAHALPE